jgi:hypothetical protein
LAKILFNMNLQPGSESIEIYPKKRKYTLNGIPPHYPRAEGSGKSFQAALQKTARGFLNPTKLAVKLHVRLKKSGRPCAKVTGRCSAAAAKNIAVVPAPGRDGFVLA